jgi:hypothetical protein
VMKKSGCRQWCRTCSLSLRTQMQASGEHFGKDPFRYHPNAYVGGCTVRLQTMVPVFRTQVAASNADTMANGCLKHMQYG